jgi:hypothetical protein
MQNNITPVQVTFSIRQSRCLEFNFTEFGNNSQVEFDFDKYLFNFSLLINVDAEKQFIDINLSVNLNGNRESNKEKIAELKSINSFHVLNFNEIAKNSERGPEIPNDLIVALIGISLSNLRGMLSVKLEGSKYTNAVIPIMDANQFLPKPVKTIG